MPIYRLKCRKCGKETRKILKVSERLTQTCECGGKFDNQLAQGSFILKGQGWYKDGYQ